MEQIKVDESPKNWLVLDHYVESGNAKFVSEEVETYCKSCNGNNIGIYFIDVDFCLDCTGKVTDIYVRPKEIFGTKHIQLITANPRPSTIYGIIAGSKDGVLGNQDVWERSKLFIKSGKDFFIYKVTEEK